MHLALSHSFLHYSLVNVQCNRIRCLSFNSCLFNKVYLEEHLLCVCVCVCVCVCIQLRAMSDVTRKSKQEMGLKAKDIFQEHITSVTKQLQKILAPFKAELVRVKIMSEDAIDLGMLGVGQFQMASKLYSIVMTTMEVDPSKFPDVVAIFFKFPELCTIAEGIEEQGDMAWTCFILE